jgi:hypothetical protein
MEIAQMKPTEQSVDQLNSANVPSGDWLFDAFATPRTMPTLWDLSGMTGTAKSAGNNGSVPAAPSSQPAVEQTEIEETGAALHIVYLNPFPEPRTYPAF